MRTSAIMRQLPRVTKHGEPHVWHDDTPSGEMDVAAPREAAAS